MVGRVVHQRVRALRLSSKSAGRYGRRMQGGREPFALRQRKLIAAFGRWRAAAGFLFLVDNRLQAAVLEHYALPRLNAIGTAVKEAGDQNIGRVDAGVIDAGVPVGAETHFHIGCSGTANENAEVGSHQNIGVAAGGEAGLDGAMIHGHQESGDFAGA